MALSDDVVGQAGVTGALDIGAHVASDDAESNNREFHDWIQNHDGHLSRVAMKYGAILCAAV